MGQRRTPPPGWLEQLPAIAVVQSTIHGADATDTAARQDAALSVMMDVIEGLSGVSHMDASMGAVPEPAKTRWLEYRRAIGKGPGAGKSAGQYYGDLDYHQEVLSKLVSPAVKQAYESSGRYQDLVALMPVKGLEGPNGQVNCAVVLKLIADGRVEEGAPLTRGCDQEAMRAAFVAKDSQITNGEYPECVQMRMLLAHGLTANAEPLRAKCEAKKAAGQARAAHAEVARSVAGDLAKANGRVDLNVFGIPLGRDSTIPDCGGSQGMIPGDQFAYGVSSLTGVNIPTTCLVQQATNQDPLSQMVSNLTAMAESDRAGYTDVILASSKRPPWVASAGVSIAGGVVLGMAIATTDENERDQVAALRAKYGRPQPDGDGLDWNLPGLFVRYTSHASIPQPADQVTGTTVNGFTTFHSGPNAGAVLMRARKPNLFIMLESAHAAQMAGQRQLKAQEPGL